MSLFQLIWSKLTAVVPAFSSVHLHAAKVSLHVLMSICQPCL